MTETETVTDKALQKRLIFAWLDALRSGEWKQTTQYLERGGKCCCLGVACRLIEREVPSMVVTSERKFDDAITFVIGGRSDARALPEPASAMIGLNDDDGQYLLDGEEYHTLMAENDAGKSFPEIADIIEANARTLFTNGEEVAGWIAERKARTGE